MIARLDPYFPFLNEDAYEGTSDTPPSLHKYLYAFGNPVVYVDPDGNAAYLASGKEFDAFGYQLYRDGNKAGAAAVAVLGAAYKVGTSSFSFGLFDEANQAITDTDTYGGAAKQFGNSVANTAKEVAKEYAEEGIIACTITVAGKLLCGRFKQACGAVAKTFKKFGDKLNTDIKVTKEGTGKPGTQLSDGSVNVPKVKKPVQPGNRGKFSELKSHKRKYGETEPVEMHEMPSYGAKKEAFREKYGRYPSTPKEKKMVRDQGISEAVTPDIHKKTSSYKGKNTKFKKAVDAKDLKAAQQRDDQELLDIKARVRNKVDK